MQKVFNKEEHWKDIMMNTLFKGCEFAGDLRAADQIYKNGIIKGPFASVPMVKGIGVVVMYIDGKLHSITTRCRRNTPYNDVTANLFKTGLFPATIPKGVTVRNPIKIYGTVSMSVEDYSIRLWQYDTRYKPASLERCIKKALTSNYIKEGDLEFLQFIPYTTNMIVNSYLSEFETLMQALGYKTYPWASRIELQEFYDYPDERLFDLDEFNKHMPSGKMIYHEHHNFLCSGLLVLIDKAVRWRYHFYRRRIFSRHAFMVRYPSECKTSFITEIRRFTDAAGVPRAILRVKPVFIDGFVIKSTNIVSPKSVEEMELEVGSKVVLTVKPGGQPHLIKQKEKHKYNV